MPGDRKDEVCQKALQLLGSLCSSGTLENENCLDFIYYLRDLDRPRLADSDCLTAHEQYNHAEDSLALSSPLAIPFDIVIHNQCQGYS